MVFERFKNAIKNMSLDELNREIQERKKLLFKWNSPIERTVSIEASSTKAIKTYSKHPYDKIRKELAILTNLVHQIINQK